MTRPGRARRRRGRRRRHRPRRAACWPCAPPTARPWSCSASGRSASCTPGGGGCSRRGRAGRRRRWRALGDGPVAAHLGPCIRAGCYEFDGPERDELAARFGAGVLGTTTWGTPALDLPPASHAALAAAGVDRGARHLGLHGLRPPLVQPPGPGRRRSGSPPPPGWRRRDRRRRPAGRGSASASRRPAAIPTGSASWPSPRATRPSAVRGGGGGRGCSTSARATPRSWSPRPTRSTRRCAGTSSGASSATRCARSPGSCTCGSRSTGCRWRPRSPATRPGAAVLVQVNVSGQRAPGRLPAGAGRRGGRGLPRPRPRRARA